MLIYSWDNLEKLNLTCDMNIWIHVLCYYSENSWSLKFINNLSLTYHACNFVFFKLSHDPLQFVLFRPLKILYVVYWFSSRWDTRNYAYYNKSVLYLTLFSNQVFETFWCTTTICVARHIHCYRIELLQHPKFESFKN